MEADPTCKRKTALRKLLFTAANKASQAAEYLRGFRKKWRKPLDLKPRLVNGAFLTCILPPPSAIQFVGE